nr:reverse transcriptase domain-containing protein [Tanacetum cinerariifolium]
MEAQYGKFLDMIRAVRIDVTLVDVLAGMPNYGKFLKELVKIKNKIEQISATLLSDESSAILQNKAPPKLGDPKSLLIPCNFNSAFSCNALADLCASINLMSYYLYAKLSPETLKPTKMSCTLPADFVILEIEEDSKVSLITGRSFLHTADAVIRVKQKKLNLGVGTERMIFHIDSAMKHSYLNDDTRFSIDVIDEILEEDFDALLDEGSEILPSNEGTILEEKLFAEFNEFMAMIADENFESKSDTEEPPFEKITFNTDYKIKHLLKNLLRILNSNLILITWNMCMLAIFHDMIEESVEVFMDDFSVFGSSFDHCLNNLNKMLERCKDAHFVLNWEKCHFMVKEGIVLGYKVSEAGLAVDKAKNQIGAILGQNDGKNFHPVYFASKTLNSAQQNYTITEKELMAVVFAFDNI